ncbi:hypothetical protein AKJ16_DCAP23857 [Drosera capensis]
MDCITMASDCQSFNMIEASITDLSLQGGVIQDCLDLVSQVQYASAPGVVRKRIWPLTKWLTACLNVPATVHGFGPSQLRCDHLHLSKAMSPT